MEKISLACNRKQMVLGWAHKLFDNGFKVWARATGGNGYPGKEKYKITIYNNLELSYEDFIQKVNELTK